MAEATPTTTTKPKNFSATLRDEAGNMLRFVVEGRKNGTLRMFALHVTKDKDGQPVTTRGASGNFPGYSEARKAFDGAVAKANAAGWKQNRTFGMVRRPDVFTLDSLPKPAGAKGKK